MGLLIFAIVALIVAGVVCAIVYQIPFPAPVAWLRWALACLALLVAVILILQRAGALPA